jgi:hypothetical protein
MKQCLYSMGLAMLLFSCMAVKSQDLVKSDASPSIGQNYSLLTPRPYSDWAAASMYQKKASNVHKKRFFFTASFDPNFTHTTPPIYTYFEYGIANLASVGASIGASYDRIDMPTYDIETGYLAVGPRVIAYPLAIISKIIDKELTGAGFEPHIGLVYDFVVMKRQVDDQDDESFTDSQLGFTFGTRWYPGNKNRFALFAEYNTNGIGNSIFKVDYPHLDKSSGGFRVGITLGR